MSGLRKQRHAEPKGHLVSLDFVPELRGKQLFLKNSSRVVWFWTDITEDKEACIKPGELVVYTGMTVFHKKKMIVYAVLIRLKNLVPLFIAEHELLSLFVDRL